MPDAFRRPGRTRGVQDVERVVEGQRLELRLVVPSCAQELGVEDTVRQYSRGGFVKVRHNDNCFDIRELFEHAPHTFQTLDTLAVIEMRLRGKDHLGPDLAEAVEHAVYAKVR